jgi:hypothetical protein
MNRLFLFTLLGCLFPASLFAQKPVKNYDELQQLLSEAGLTAEIKKESIRVAIPESKWELYAYLTGRGSKVWLSFTCQPLPKDAPLEKVRELLESNDDGVTGCYFSVNGKSKNIYINLMIDNRALTSELLREKVNTLADFAIKHTKLWDPANWESARPMTRPDDPNATPAMETPKLHGEWTIKVEEKQLTLQGKLNLDPNGSFTMKLADQAGAVPAVTIEGKWKQQGNTLLMTSKAGKTSEFHLIASITGSKTEYQFQGKDQGQAKMILSRE